VWRAAADRRLLSTERRLPPRVDYGTPAPAETLRPRTSVGIRVAYGVVAALALWLLLRGMTSTPAFESVQAANQVISGLVLLILAVAAGLGLCRIPVVRYACPLMGVWLMLSSLLLPGPYSGWVILSGVAAFGASGWAADAMALRQQPSKEL